MPTLKLVSQEYVDNKLKDKSDSTHAHQYAGSSSVGGAATSANKLTINAGDSNTPVYFTNGVPTACTSLDLNTTGNAATATKLATARSIRTNLASTSAVNFDGSANITPGVTGVLPIANGGTGSSNAGGILNKIGQGTYTVGVNNALDYASWFEVARCPITAGGLTQRTTILVNGSWGHGAGILHICLVVDGSNNNTLATAHCEMQLMAKTNKLSSGKFAVDCSSTPGVAILYVYLNEQSWFNFKPLHQQSYANYSADGTDIVNLPNIWTFKTNYGPTASANRKSSITKTLYC